MIKIKRIKAILPESRTEKWKQFGCCDVRGKIMGILLAWSTSWYPPVIRLPQSVVSSPSLFAIHVPRIRISQPSARPCRSVVTVSSAAGLDIGERGSKDIRPFHHSKRNIKKQEGPRLVLIGGPGKVGGKTGSVGRFLFWITNIE